MWYETWSESKQRPYYVNSVTRETSWVIPSTYVTSEIGYDEVARNESRESVQKMTEHVRKESNRAKRTLIEQGVGNSKNIRVLDLACGKGGDLWKWRDNGCAQYVGIDSSEYSIEEARERAAKVNFSTRFEVLDLRRECDWASTFGGMFDILSIQFALHYLFSSEKTAKKFFQRAARACKPGGRMLATFPSCDIVTSILNGQRDPPEFMHFETDSRLLTSQKPVVYKYTFEGSVPGIPEHTIPVYMLEKICEETGWIPRHVSTFHNLYHAYIFIRQT